MTRHALIAELRDRLLGEGSPRAQILFLLAVAGAGAFLSSAAMLRAGLASMGWRYALAALIGYALFLLLIRLWIAWQRRRWEWRDLPDVPAAGGHTSGSTDDYAPPPIFSGGRSGGAGGGAAWHESSANVAADASAIEPDIAGDVAKAVPLDLDESWPLVLAAALALSGALAIAYTVYIAPVLLAEVALDAALVTTVYRRLRWQDARHWTASVVRRTWVPASVLVTLLLVGGLLVQAVLPEADSIGDVLRGLAR